MRYLIITKRHIMIFAAVFVSFAVLSITSAFALQNKNRLLPIYSVNTNKKVVALSFDAAWGNEDTQDLIDILKKYAIKATFFVVASWVDKYPESVKALHDAGHEIGNHSTTHPHMPKLSTEEMTNEVKTCNEKIKNVTNTEPILFRAPYGDYNNNVIKTLGDLNMYTIQWDVDSRDWMEGHTAEKITQDATKNVQNGSIILFHNAAVNTPAALPNIIENLKSQGYSFVKISDLIIKENYTIDHAGRQQSNEDNNSGSSSSPNNTSNSSEFGSSSN